MQQPRPGLSLSQAWCGAGWGGGHSLHPGTSRHQARGEAGREAPLCPKWPLEQVEGRCQARLLGLHTGPGDLERAYRPPYNEPHVRQGETHPGWVGF